jgi:hypothetical protein
MRLEFKLSLAFILPNISPMPWNLPAPSSLDCRRVGKLLEDDLDHVGVSLPLAQRNVGNRA